MNLIVCSTMFSSYFASITEHSFLCICKVFISKEFVRFSSGLGRFYADKRIIQSKDFDANVHADSVPSAVQRVQCPFGHRSIMCNPFQGSNSLQGANNLFREIEKSFRGANNLFQIRESENSLRGEIYNRLREANKSSIVPSTHFFRETMYYLVLETMSKAITSPVFVEQRHLTERVECFCPSAFVKAVPRWMPCRISRCYSNNAFENAQYDSHNMSDCDVNDSIFLSENQRYNCPISRCVHSHRHSRLCSRVKTPMVRDREPSRISLRKRIHSLKCRKLRRQHKKKI